MAKKIHDGDDFSIAGYELDGEWQDVDKGAPLPSDEEWHGVSFMTINLTPDAPEPFYRNVRIFGGLDPIGEGYDIYEAVGQLRSRYTFLAE